MKGNVQPSRIRRLPCVLRTLRRRSYPQLQPTRPALVGIATLTLRCTQVSMEQVPRIDLYCVRSAPFDPAGSYRPASDIDLGDGRSRQRGDVIQ